MYRQVSFGAVSLFPIGNSRELARKIAEFAPNTQVDVKVLRAGKEEAIKVKLGNPVNTALLSLIPFYALFWWYYIN